METDAETASAETDGFSYYTVEFTYNELQYVMEGDETVDMDVILQAIGLEGDVTEVEFSNEKILSARKEGEGWTVTALRAFVTEEWMKVTINGVAYEVDLTDDLDVPALVQQYANRKFLNEDCGILSISAGYQKSSVVRSDGTLWSWGSGAYTGLAAGAEGYGVPRMIVSGSARSAKVGMNGSSVRGIVKEDGSLWVYGTGDSLGTDSTDKPQKILEMVPFICGGNNIMESWETVQQV